VKSPGSVGGQRKSKFPSHATVNLSFTRLTNAYSKKVENSGHAVALYFAYYNLCRVHQTLGVTPAMGAGLSDHVWSVEELIAQLPVEQPKKRGPYRTRYSN
jgi:hypothetical protein